MRLVLAALAVALAVAPSASAIGAPPVVTSVVTNSDGLTTITFAGYEPKNGYFVELALGSTMAPDGSFVVPAEKSPVISLLPTGLGTWYVPRKLPPALYFVHVANDFTRPWLDFQNGICAALGCFPTWDGKPKLAWSPVSTFTVAPPVVKPKPVHAKPKKPKPKKKPKKR
jgi:hypothetical protein